MSRKTLSSGPFMPYSVSTFLFLVTSLTLSGKTQEIKPLQDAPLNPTVMEWIAPNYQPVAPARIQAALLNETKPVLNRLAPVYSSDAKYVEMNGTGSSTGLQMTFHDELPEPRQNPLPLMNRGSFDDMAQSISQQLTNPNLSIEQRASILRAAFETVAQRTRLDSRQQLEATEQRYQRQMALLEADRAQVQSQASALGNIRQWLQTLYSNQSRNSAQIQQMSLDNAALKKSLQTLQQQVVQKTVSQVPQPEPMILLPNASQMLRPQPMMTDETPGPLRPLSDQTETKQTFGSDGSALMVWDPLRGYHLKPLEMAGTTTVSNPQKVIRADYQMQIDRELEGLHRQMETLTAQIKAFQDRRRKLPPPSDPLQPVYSPEQELKPLESNFGNPLPSFRR